MGNFWENIGSSFGEVDLETIINRIEAKAPENRAPYEKDLLRIYTEAEAQGTEFCTDKLKEKAAEHLRDNYIVYLALFAVIAVLLAKNSNK